MTFSFITTIFLGRNAVRLCCRLFILSIYRDLPILTVANELTKLEQMYYHIHVVTKNVPNIFMKRQKWANLKYDLALGNLPLSVGRRVYAKGGQLALGNLWKEYGFNGFNPIGSLDVRHLQTSVYISFLKTQRFNLSSVYRWLPEFRLEISAETTP